MTRQREHKEQRYLMEWAQRRAATMPELDLLFAIPNGATFDDDPRTAAIRGKYMKAEGLKPGVPDLCLPVACGGFHGLFIEMKAPPVKTLCKELNRRAGVVSPGQKGFIGKLMEQGYRATVAFGWYDAKTIIEGYLSEGRAI